MKETTKPILVEKVERYGESVYITFRDDPDTKYRMGPTEARNFANQLMKATQDKSLNLPPVPSSVSPFGLGEK